MRNTTHKEDTWLGKKAAAEEKGGHIFICSFNIHVWTLKEHCLIPIAKEDTRSRKRAAAEEEEGRRARLGAANLLSIKPWQEIVFEANEQDTNGVSLAKWKKISTTQSHPWNPENELCLLQIRKKSCEWIVFVADTHEIHEILCLLQIRKSGNPWEKAVRRLQVWECSVWESVNPHVCEGVWDTLKWECETHWKWNCDISEHTECTS